MGGGPEDGEVSIPEGDWIPDTTDRDWTELDMNAFGNWSYENFNENAWEMEQLLALWLEESFTRNQGLDGGEGADSGEPEPPMYYVLDAGNAPKLESVIKAEASLWDDTWFDDEDMNRRFSADAACTTAGRIGGVAVTPNRIKAGAVGAHDFVLGNPLKKSTAIAWSFSYDSDPTYASPSVISYVTTVGGGFLLRYPHPYVKVGGGAVISLPAAHDVFVDDTQWDFTWRWNIECQMKNGVFKPIPKLVDLKSTLNSSRSDLYRNWNWENVVESKKWAIKEDYRGFVSHTSKDFK